MKPVPRGVLLAMAFAGTLAAFDPPREPAPNFIATTLDGETFSNSSLQGKTVLLQFWATWCGYCRREQPAVDAIVRDYRDKGVVVLAVNVKETRGKVTEYLGKAPRACKVVLTEDTNLVSAFGARAFPTYVVIDRKGNVAGKQEGSAGEEALRELLRDAGVN